MNRRNFLLKIIIWVLSFFFGYRLGKSNILDQGEPDSTVDLNSLEIDGKKFILFDSKVTDIYSFLKSAIEKTPENGKVLIPKGSYTLEKTIKVSKNIKIVGNNTEFITNKDGLDGMFIFNAENVHIQGIKFNQNLKGRSTLKINNSKTIRITECDFTGYSAEFGHAPTDSAILINNPTVTCETVIMKGNMVFDHGFQYDNTSYLNRAITIQGKVNKAVISDNIFKNVNQGVVTTSGLVSFIFNSNTISGVKDNFLYVLSTKKTVISGNDFSEGLDECIVISGDNVKISDNIFTEIANKAIGINAKVQNLSVTDNIFQNETTPLSSFLAWRDSIHVVENLILTRNEVHQKVSNITNPYTCYFGVVNNFIISSNIFNLATLQNQAILYFNEIATGQVEGNHFIGGNFTSPAISLGSNYASGSIIFRDNLLKGCRLRADNKYIIVEGYMIKSNADPYVTGLTAKRTVYLNGVPSKGTWRVGDIVYNTTPMTGGYIGWICIKSGIGTNAVWKRFGAIEK